MIDSGTDAARSHVHQPTIGDMLHVATIAIVGAVTTGMLWHAIPSFPTISGIRLRFLEEHRSKNDHTFL